MMLLKQSSTATPLTFLLVSSTDHVSPVAGASPTVTLSKAGAAFAAPAGTVSEIGSGWYKLVPTAADSGTLGGLILHATATNADPTDREYEVVAFDPQLVSMGLALAKGTNLTGFNDIAVGAKMDLIDAPSATAVTAIQAGLSRPGTAQTITAPYTTAQIAAAVESAIMNETDGTQVLQAIVDKINAADPSLSGLTLSAIAAAVRDVSLASAAAGGLGDTIKSTGTAAARIPASPASTGDAMTLTVPERTTLAGVFWGSLTSALTTAGSIGKRILDFFGAGNYTAPPTDYQQRGVAVTLPVLPAVALTVAERETLAGVVESHLLNDGDGQMLLNAIVGAIGNQNIDQLAFVAAVRADPATGPRC